MDIIQIMELNKLADKHIELSEQYEQARTKAGDAEAELDILMVPHLEAIRAIKSNAGYTMSVLMFLETSEVAKALYKEKVASTARYKGLERIIEALKSKISLNQSIMKYVVDNT